MPNVVCDILRQAAKLNLSDTNRRGSTVGFGDDLEVIVAGDLHGNRSALNKIISYASLDKSPSRRLILQEIIHGPEDPRCGHDRSIELLIRAARLKVAQGEKLVILLGNHDVAQVTGSEISKQGRGACKAFAGGVNFCFTDDAREVLDAVGEFCLSLPLVVRCPNGALITHSLPSPHRMDQVDLDILERQYRNEDMVRGGTVYEWTWGRDQTEEQTDELARKLGVEFFILGHRHTPDGYEILTSRAVTIASDHQRGCVVHFNSSEPLTSDNIAEHITPIIALGKASQDHGRNG